MSFVPELANDAVLKRSQQMPKETLVVKGYDWKKRVDYNKLLHSYKYFGFQATNFSLAVDEIKKMLHARDIELNKQDEDLYEDDEFIRRKNNCTIFFAYNTHTESSDLKQATKFLVQNKLIDCIVTTTGGIEDDLKRCLIADNYEISCSDGLYKKWVNSTLNEMLVEQKILWTPSKLIERLGQKINCEGSICYWAAKNKIPVFCPAFTESGLIADEMYFQSLQKPWLIVDILDDLRKINMMAMKARSSGIISVGAGIPKHHVCKANCIRDGADFAVYLNTACEYDGSDSGAEPGESVACGKIKIQANPVKIHSEPNLIFPFLVGETFVKHFINKK